MPVKYKILNIGVHQSRPEGDLTYFNLGFYEPLKMLLKRGIKYIYAGSALYESKARRGYSTYVSKLKEELKKHTNLLLHDYNSYMSAYDKKNIYEICTRDGNYKITFKKPLKLLCTI